MTKPTIADLAALLVQLRESAERANAALDATSEHWAKNEASKTVAEEAARARAIEEFKDIDLVAFEELLGFREVSASNAARIEKCKAALRAWFSEQAS